MTGRVSVVFPNPIYFPETYSIRHQPDRLGLHVDTWAVDDFIVNTLVGYCADLAMHWLIFTASTPDIGLRKAQSLILTSAKVFGRG
jgi:hypothetical protein